MTKFSAKDALEPLEYDLTPFHDVRGEVPEPTDDMVAEFYSSLATTLKDTLGEERLEGFDLDTPSDVGRLFISLSKDDREMLSEALLDLHVAVCGGSPSREAVADLPYRQRQAWYGAVQGWLRPEASRPATTS